MALAQDAQPTKFKSKEPNEDTEYEQEVIFVQTRTQSEGSTPVRRAEADEVSTKIWGCSSAGRAPALQAGGQEFDSPHLQSFA